MGLKDFITSNHILFISLAALMAIIGTNLISIFSAPFVYPVIEKFDSNPNTIFKHDSAKLTWSVLDANNVNIKNVGNNLPTHSSKDVFPMESTNYSLTASKWHGWLKSTATQEVHVWNPQVNITSPEDGSSVKASATISGTFSGDLPEDYYIWIVVRSAKAEADKWWTQGEAAIGREPIWNVPGSFGGEQDVGENFTIKAILVDETVNYILLRNGRDGIYLPPTIKTLNAITVIRNPGDLVLSITSPENGAHVSSPVSIEGNAYGAIPKYDDIWIIHSPINSGIWYPDGSIIGSIMSNTWKQQVSLVDPAGTEYSIKAVLVSNETSKEYQNNIKVGLETGVWKGFPESEEEGRARVLDSILLIKRNG